MDNKRSIINSLREVTAQEAYQSYPAEVLSVNEATCAVKSILNEVEYDDVRLNAQADDPRGIVCTPAIGSVVLVTEVDAGNRFVSMFSEVDVVEITIGDSVITVDGVNTIINTPKIAIQNQDTSLLTLIGDLLSLLETRYQVSTPAGPSAAVLPQTKQALTQLRNDFEKLLK